MRLPGNPEIVVNNETFPLSIFDSSKYSIDKERKIVTLENKQYPLLTNIDVENFIRKTCKEHNVTIINDEISFVMEKHPYFETETSISYWFLLELKCWKIKVKDCIVRPVTNNIVEVLIERP